MAYGRSVVTKSDRHNITVKVALNTIFLILTLCLGLPIAWFSPGTPFSSTNNTDYYYIAVTGGAGPANPSGAHEFNPGFEWSSCVSIICFLCSVL